METMWKLRTVVGIVAISTFAACSRGVATKATLKITAPSDVHAKAAVPTGQTACYAVNITGTGITNSTPTCNPPLGILAGYVQSGQDIQVEVPMNQTLNVDLYLYLMPVGQSGPCPTLSTTLPATQLPNTYLVGSASGVSTATPQVSVDIAVNFPAANTNITQQLSLPTICQVASGGVLPATPFSVSAGGEHTLSNGSYVMRAHVGSSYKRPVLTNSNYNLIVR